MMRAIIACNSLLLFLAMSCTRKVELAKVGNIGLTELQDLSEIYLFFEPKNKDSLYLNDHNVISNTNWVFHVDRRLRLGTVVTTMNGIIKRAQEKKIHTRKGKGIYISVADTLRISLSLLDFTAIHWVLKASDKDSTHKLNKNRNHFFIEFYKNGKAVWQGQEMKWAAAIEAATSSLNNPVNGKINELHLFFDPMLSFQEYINLKINLSSTVNSYFFINWEEQVYLDRKKSNAFIL